MKLKLLLGEYAFSQLPHVPNGLKPSSDFVMLSVAEDEISFLAPAHLTPADAIRTESGWVVFKLDAVMEFSLVGIMARLSGVLAEAGVSILAMSTYNTDYVAVKAVDLQKAVRALEAEGYKIQK